MWTVRTISGCAGRGMVARATLEIETYSDTVEAIRQEVEVLPALFKALNQILATIRGTSAGGTERGFALEEIRRIAICALRDFPISPESHDPTPGPTPTPMVAVVSEESPVRKALLAGMSLTDEIRENCAAFEDVNDEVLKVMVRTEKAVEAHGLWEDGRDAQIGYLVGAGIHPPDQE